MGPVEFVVFPGLVEFMKFEKVLWLVELLRFEGFQRFMGPVEFMVLAGFVVFMKFDGVLWASGVGGVRRVSEVHGACGIRGVCRVCGVHEV